MDKLKIYICTHTDFVSSVTNPVYQILDSRKLFKNDIAPNGILAMIYSELISYKYVADNYSLPDYIGFCHYRKYFDFMDNVQDVCDEVDKFGSVGVKLNFKCSVREHYARCHNGEDLDLALELLKSNYPELYESFLNHLNGCTLYACNMFVMRKNDFIEYIKFIFDILDKIVSVLGTNFIGRVTSNINYHKIKSPGNSPVYQSRILGFVGERLTSAYLNWLGVNSHKMIITKDRLWK